MKQILGILSLVFFSIVFSNCAKEDNPITTIPTLTLHDFTLTVVEHSNKPFGKVKTTLSDTLLNYEVRYSLLSVSVPDQITLDSITGEIKASDPNKLDYEVIQEITGKIKATSTFNSDTCNFTIKITNELDFFEVPDQHFSINENPAKGGLIGTIKVTSERKPVTFTYYTCTLGKIINIDPNTGNVTVKDSQFFDYEVNPIINFTVDISNGVNKKRQSFNINVKDITDYVPFQVRLNNGKTPFELMDENPLNKDSLYGNLYQGGYIFYLDNAKKDCYVVNGYNHGGNTQWTRYNIWIDGLDTSIGAGASNTQILLKALSGETVVTGYGAYRYGYTDWYIPSIAEMRAIHKNYYVKNSKLFSYYRYWTSNQASSSSGIEVRFFVDRMLVKGHSKEYKLQKLWVRKTN